MSSSLIPDKNSVIIGLARADQQEKQAKKEKGEYRSQLFHIADVEGEDQVLPRQTTQIPVGFLNKIGMQENHFLASRFPGWRKVESRKVNDEGKEDREGEWIEYLLERDPAFLPYVAVAEGDGFTIKTGRTIQQNSPELDQRTLQKDMPEVFDRIMKPVVSYEVDVNKMETLLSEQPELLPKLQLHFAYPAPIPKLASIKEIVDEQE